MREGDRCLRLLGGEREIEREGERRGGDGRLRGGERVRLRDRELLASDGEPRRGGDLYRRPGGEREFLGVMDLERRRGGGGDRDEKRRREP